MLLPSPLAFDRSVKPEDEADDEADAFILVAAELPAFFAYNCEIQWNS